MKFIKFLIIMFLLLAGCAKTKFPEVVPTAGPSLKNKPFTDNFYPAIPPSEGSLWNDTGNMLFVDQKASKIGDTVIVDIIENTSSSIKANTKTSKDSSIDAGISNFLGYMRQFEELKNPDKKGMIGSKMIGAKYKNDFNGKGTSDRSGQITASIGARVIEVFPNGNMSIYGEREMKVNNELQYIKVSGVIRANDVGADNRVKSVYLSDAYIEYSGKGVIGDKQKTGWLTRIVDNVWPF